MSSLWIVRPGDWYTILVSWRPDGSHLGSYVNLQEPMRRNPIGSKRWTSCSTSSSSRTCRGVGKTHKEFDEIVERGIFAPDLGEQVQATALSVIETSTGPGSVLRSVAVVDTGSIMAGSTTARRLDQCAPLNSTEHDVIERQAGRVVLLDADDAFLLIEVIPAALRRSG